MYFTEKVLVDLAAEHEAINARYVALYERFLRRRYVSERGKEFGHHGMLRRLQSLKRCIANVYRLLPPERDEVPDDDTRHDAELQVQAFVFHTFGAADNLASWPLVHWKGEFDNLGDNVRSVGAMTRR